MPATDADRVVWLSNFSNRLGQYRVALGLTQAETNSVVADADMFAYIVQLQGAAQHYAQAISNTKRQLRNAAQQVAMPALPNLPSIGTAPAAVSSGIFNRLALLVTRIKQSGAYTGAMGQDLGVIAPVHVIDPNTMMPNLSIRLESGFPLLKWKKGDSDSINIYVDRRDGNGFVLLAHTVKNSFIDTQALPPNTFTVSWDYKGRYLIGDDEVGQFSQVLSINVLRVS